MAKKKSGSRRLHDHQYHQIISKEQPAAEKILKQLGLKTTSLGDLPYSHRISAQTAQSRDYSLHSIARDISELKEKDKIVAYYARPDVQREMFRYAEGRSITVLRSFKPMFTGLREREHILPLMFHYLSGGNRWPSMHGTILRKTADGKKVCDFVFEPDFKKNWAVAFGAARPIVRLFMSMGLPFFLKFSGSTSPHIIVPGEALSSCKEKDMKSQEFRTAVYAFVMNRMHRPGLLDGPKWEPDHFLRLAYSIHELGGRVSMPIKPEEFDSFNPDKARIENAVVLEDWWHIPEDAADRGREFVERVLENYPRLVGGADIPKSEHKWKPPKVPRKLRQIFNADWYNKALTNGRSLLSPVEVGGIRQQAYPKMPDAEMTKALDMLKRWKDTGVRIDLQAAADVFKVDIIELRCRWGAISSDIDHSYDMADADFDPSYHYRYYSRSEIQEALYQYAAGRCFSVYKSESHFRLQEPSDIPPLAALFASSNAKWSGFKCTRGLYDFMDNQIAACDIEMVIDFSRSDHTSAIELAQILTGVLQRYDVFCFAKFDGDEALEIVIPAEALPKQVDGQATALQINQIATGLNRGFRRIPEVRGNDCLLDIHPYGYTRPAYSINQQTGLACVVLMREELQKFSPENAKPIDASVGKAWLDIPENAALQAQRFLKYALSPKWHPMPE